MACPGWRPIERAANESGINPATIEARYKTIIKDKTRRGQEMRRAAVVKLAQRGFDNREIADKLEIHRNTVSRDIGRVFREVSNA